MECHQTRGDQTLAGHPDPYQPPSGVWMLAVWDLDPDISRVDANHDNFPLPEPSGCVPRYKEPRVDSKQMNS